MGGCFTGKSDWTLEARRASENLRGVCTDIGRYQERGKEGGSEG